MNEHLPSEPPQEEDMNIIKVSNGFKCKICNLIVKTKYSMKRHVLRMHGQGSKPTVVEVSNLNVSKKSNLVDVLKNYKSDAI